MAKKVTVIEATQKNEVLEESALRVCAYCRVSSMHEEQQNSFSAQMSYYSEYISANAKWTFVGIYADEGISGTTKEKRLDFMRLINDCEAGLIDFVITKSISRFARNTADCIEIIRTLKALGIGVLFEKENINTLSQESELVLSVLSSIAQEESLSISSNIRWSKQKQFSQGKVPRRGKFLGYDYNENINNYVINDDEAQIIRPIYSWCINGMGTCKIRDRLNQLNIPAIKGGKWSQSSVGNVLKNPMYCGDVLLQKTITVDLVNYKRKKNEGELPQYYVKDNHPPIISREDFQLVQKILKQRALKNGITEEVLKTRINRYPLTSKIVCGVCNGKYNHIRSNATNAKTKKKYSRSGWCCKYDGRKHCGNRAVWDIAVEGLIIQVFNKLWSNIDTILIPYRDTLRKLYQRDGSEELEAINNLNNELRVIAQLAAKGALSPVLYNAQSSKIVKQLDDYKKRRLQATQAVVLNNQKLKSTEDIISKLKETEHAIKDLDESTINLLIKEIVVFPKNIYHVVLNNGMRLVEYDGGERYDI